MNKFASGYRRASENEDYFEKDDFEKIDSSWKKEIEEDIAERKKKS
jgi:hypothetical protein